MSIANEMIMIKSRHAKRNVKVCDYMLIEQMARGSARERCKSNEKTHNTEKRGRRRKT